ncbi:MAG: sugar phosphate isomerase/epimerase [Planctomycetes bacterium]|nr:sugar phosphate isomerase/epimerase [Planctomycetota bacterium]
MTQFGLQLYMFPRKMVDQDFSQILNKVSVLGYSSVEGVPAHLVDYSQECADLSLQYMAPHIVAADLKDLDTLISYCQTMGAKNIISSGLIEWNERSPDDYQATISFLNAAAQELQKNNIRLHYHNHEFEFELVDSEQQKTGMDILLAGLDDAVHFCIDLGWAALAGVDGCQWLRENASRVSYAHLRDFKDGTSVALGDGELPVVDLISCIKSLPDIQQVMVEQDPTSEDPYRDAQRSYQFMKQYL